MKKTIIVALCLMFGLASQTQAVGSTPNQGTKTGQTDTTVQGQTGNTVSTQEQNQIMNQGAETQIQTQEQNAVETKDKTNGKTDQVTGKTTPEQRKSAVASAVQAMLQIADREGGIGQQVRTIAQNQNQNQTKLEQDIEKIQGRSGLTKFFIGAKYGEIKDAQKTLDQNKEQIRQMNQLRTQLSNAGDQQQLAEQIKVLEQANQEIETLLTEAQSGFSLFGWAVKLFQ